MRVIVTVDDRGGVLFNHRRQSSDRVVRRKIEELSEGHALWMTKYTASQFLTLPEQARLSEQPLRDAGPEDYCFVEGEPLLPYKDDMEELVRILWNRKYPGSVMPVCAPRPRNSGCGLPRGKPWMICCRKPLRWCGKLPAGCWGCAISMYS